MDKGKSMFLDELNCNFFSPNWDISLDQNDPFESALSSMVSSPTASSANGNCENGENVVLRELIGRLGSICNSGEISAEAYKINSANTSCYSTPLNSPPKSGFRLMENHQIKGNFQNPGNHFPPMFNFAPFPGDPGLAERAARFSCFGNMGVDEMGGKLESGKLSRVSSGQSVKIPESHLKGIRETKVGAGIPVSGRKTIRNSAPENSELGDSRENSSVSERIPFGESGLIPQNDAHSRKRKSTQRGKGKETPSSTANMNNVVASENNDSNAKRSKSDDGSGNKKQSDNNNNSKALEPQKDYIHVRARRGQATDAHSLAERVRREKISERMKLLQDLVPGCSKVTGKAVMLDEIINYVQSLQKQVEFLSMKLTIVNPRMDINNEALLSKDFQMLQSRGSLPQDIFTANGYTYQSEALLQTNHFPTALSQNQGDQLSYIDSFRQISSQVPSFMDDDLRSIVHMGFGHNQTLSRPFHGVLPPTTQIKIEP